MEKRLYFAAFSFLLVLLTGGVKAHARGHRIEFEFATHETAELPKLLREAIFKSGEIKDIVNGEWQLPETLSLSLFDLNGDGSPEYTIYAPTLSGSGGGYYIVFQLQKHSFVKIADFQGRSIWLEGRSGGYFTIRSAARRGSAGYEYFTLRYSNGRYHVHSTFEKSPGSSVRTDNPRLLLRVRMLTRRCSDWAGKERWTTSSR